MKKAWRKLEVGDCGLYPCMNCGNPIDDMLYNKEERICASCSVGYRASKRKDLLKEVLVLLIAHCPPESPDSQDLIERIKKELD